MASTPSASWQNPRILLTLFVIFLCGACAGMLTMALGAHRWMHAQTLPAAPAWKESGREVSLQRFRQELNLSPQQTEQLETILDDFFTYYHTLQAQLDDVRASGKQKILRILDENQKKKFEKLMTELQEKQQLR
jgi:hypothetical protein